MQKGLAPILIVVGIVILLVVAGGAYYFGKSQTNSSTPQTQIVSSPIPLPSVTSVKEGDETANWKTYTSSEFGYSISYPPEFEVTGEKQITLMRRITEPSGVPDNFITITVVPHGSYNFGLIETMKVGETTSPTKDANNLNERGFTYTRLPDITVGGTTAKTYINTNPYEFSPGVKEYRYHIDKGNNLYWIEGFIERQDTTQIDYISEQLFQRILSTFKFTQ